MTLPPLKEESGANFGTVVLSLLKGMYNGYSTVEVRSVTLERENCKLNLSTYQPSDCYYVLDYQDKVQPVAVNLWNVGPRGK